MHNIRIEKIGITRVKADAIVNAANEGLWEGGGVCGAIFRDAGSSELTKACQKIGGCHTGNAVITPAFRLPAKYIIHAVGPVWRGGNNNEPELLYSAYKQSLILAKNNDCYSIAFPLISAGIFGYPKDKAWRKALQACMDFTDSDPDYDMTIIFTVLDDGIIALGNSVLDELTHSAQKHTVGYGAALTKANSDANNYLIYDEFKNEISPGKYRHYKGNEYEVIGVARHSEDEHPMVVYRALYGEKELWVRPAEMWDELVEVNGKCVKRFERIDQNRDI